MNSNINELYKLLSLEYNCAPEDFQREENVVTISELLEGRRIYDRYKYFFSMVTTGNNAVITADESLHPFLTEYVKDKKGHWLFELPNLKPIEEELNKLSHTLCKTFHMFLSKERVEPKKSFPVKWFYDEDIHAFYGDERFPNAICEKFLPHRPDRIAVCAYDGEKIMGMAGASEDAKGWLQIGVDVQPEYRSMGVGTYLVTLLKNKIEDDGNIAFYGTSISNYHSWNIALKSGFYPAWLEISTKRIR